MENVKTLPKFHPDDSKREKGLMYCESVALELVASESLTEQYRMISCVVVCHAYSLGS